MEVGEGMVAVVRGLRDSGLTVTLLENGKQYTLLPNSVITAPSAPNQPSDPSMQSSKMPSTQSYIIDTPQLLTRNPINRATANNLSPDQMQNPLPQVTLKPMPSLKYKEETSNNTDKPYMSSRIDSGAQATDGRYVSTYRTTHCNMIPTSPPDLLTEFPPQRPEVSRGHGNFQVGGAGSGDTPFGGVRANGSFRGGLNWPDRGSVCNARPSREPDPFANSLRKYPNLSPERSSEIIERLINYTQTKNVPKTYARTTMPRNESVTNSHDGVSDRLFKNSPTASKVNYDDFKNRRIEETPTRDRCKKSQEDWKLHPKPGDVRHLRDMSKRTKENIRHSSSFSCNQQLIYNGVGLMNGNSSELTDLRKQIDHTMSVHSPSQAAVAMVSREVFTQPRKQPVRRNVAVPLSPSPSTTPDAEGAVPVRLPGPSPLEPKRGASKSPPITASPTFLPINHNTNAVSSDLDLNAKRKCECLSTGCRKSKSQEFVGAKRELRNEILEWLNEVSVRDTQSKTKYEMLKKTCEKIKKISDEIDELGATATKRSKLEETTESFVNFHEKDGRGESLVCKPMGKKELKPFEFGCDEEKLRKALKKWYNIIPLETEIDSEILTDALIDLFRGKDTSDLNTRVEIKMEVIAILNKMPIVDDDGCKRNTYLISLADILLDRIYSLQNESKKGVEHNKYDSYKLGSNYSLNPACNSGPREEEIDKMIQEELLDFVQKYKFDCDPTFLKDIKFELKEILLESMESIYKGKDEAVYEEIVWLICECFKCHQHKAVQFAKDLIEILKEMFNYLSDIPSSNITLRPIRNTFPQNVTAYPLLSKQYCNHGNSHHVSKTDLGSLLDRYFEEIVNQITEWLMDIGINPQSYRNGLMQLTINDLASDIMDRHKYLEFNPSTPDKKVELEHLKYQIFKTINKLIGENNADTIANASSLMERIKTVQYRTNSRLSPENKRNLYEIHEDQRNSFKSSNSATTARSENYIKADKSRNNMYGRLPSNVNIDVRTMCFGTSGLFDAASQKNRSGKKSASSSPNKTSATPSTSGSATAPPISPEKLALQRINAEYDDYMKQWIQTIPIKAESPEERAIAEKARLGIYNGLWRAITNLRCDPAAMANRFYYEDLFEDEIEQLLDCLPQTAELVSKKPLLKAQLLAKTNDTYDLIVECQKRMAPHKGAAAAAPAKGQRITVDIKGEDPKQLAEELEILRIVEEYLFTINFKTEDKIRLEAYRNRLIVAIETLVDQLKKTHNKPFVDIDRDLYIKDLLTMIKNVPIPTDDSLRKDADDILLALEVEDWFSRLPVAKNESRMEQRQRRRLIYALTKKIHKLEKDGIFEKSSTEGELRHNVSRFLEKMPLEEGKSVNITDMVNDLSNKLKLRSNLAGNKRKNVNFQDRASPNNTFGANACCAPGPSVGTQSGTNDSANKSSIPDPNWVKIQGGVLPDWSRVHASPGQRPQSPVAPLPESQVLFRTMYDTIDSGRQDVFIPEAYRTQPEIILSQPRPILRGDYSLPGYLHPGHAMYRELDPNATYPYLYPQFIGPQLPLVAPQQPACCDPVNTSTPQEQLYKEVQRQMEASQLQRSILNPSSVQNQSPRAGSQAPPLTDCCTEEVRAQTQTAASQSKSSATPRLVLNPPFSTSQPPSAPVSPKTSNGSRKPAASGKPEDKGQSSDMEQIEIRCRCMDRMKRTRKPCYPCDDSLIYSYEYAMPRPPPCRYYY